jgi:hypothetical protein
VHEFTALGSIVEDPDFAGDKTNCVVAEGALLLDTRGDFDDVDDVDEIAVWDAIGGVHASGTYAFSDYLDLGAVQRCRLTSIIASQVFNVFDDFDQRTGDVDDWPSWDGDMSGEEADARLMVRATQDDPAGTPTWTEWQRLDSAEFQARAFDFRLDLTSSDDSFSISISSLSVVAEEVV